MSYPYDAKDGRENSSKAAHVVCCGGSFYGDRQDVRCAFRLFRYILPRYGYIGFRVLSPGS
ncbi:MAG: hypothetical protein R2873_16855 [Caldilineaceae bacterium]